MSGKRYGIDGEFDRSDAIAWVAVFVGMVLLIGVGMVVLS